jgi:hypothetical protein
MKKSDALKDDITKFSEKFYTEKPKNVFFKMQQKNELASSVSHTFDVSQLIKHTIYLIPNTNLIFIDYTVFKLFASVENYDLIVDYIITLFENIIVNHDFFEVHVNMNTFSVSAAQRYKGIIERFLNVCMNHDTGFSEKLKKMYLYYTPSVFDSIKTILNPLIHPIVKQKIELYNKTESSALLEKLFS